MGSLKRPLLAAALVVACGVAAACGSDGTTSTSPSQPAAGSPSSAAPAKTTSPAPPVGAARGDLRAGAAAVDLAMPAGVPLAGYTGRRAILPDTDGTNAVTWFKASKGVRDPVRAHALVLESGGERMTFLAVDAVAMLDSLVSAIVLRARASGSAVTREHLVVFASHTHSGPGAVTNLHFWEQAATDLLVASVRDSLVASCASAIVAAEGARVPARAGLAMGVITGATENRRAAVSKTFTPTSIDPALAVLRVDREDGSPLATLANFAIHPTALGASNLQLSGDIVGSIVRNVEQATSAVTLFAQGAEGDIAPSKKGEAGVTELGALVSKEIVLVRGTAVTKDTMRIAVSEAEVDFGPANLVLRPDGLTSDGSLDLTLLANLLGSPGQKRTVPLGPDMVDHVFRFQAIRLGDDVIAAVPGEPIHTLGLRIKSAGAALGFGRTLVFGLANGHMSYVVDREEYAAGGYETTSTLFGEDTGDRLVDAAVARLRALAP